MRRPKLFGAHSLGVLGLPSPGKIYWKIFILGEVGFEKSPPPPHPGIFPNTVKPLIAATFAAKQLIFGGGRFSEGY